MDSAGCLPEEAVTFLFTDIEGSTRLWEQHPEAMQGALACHEALLRQAIEGHGGHVFKTVGDQICAAFATTLPALEAALQGQRDLKAAAWRETGPLRVRIALHTGAAQRREGDYFGPALNRVARLLSAGHGDQILLSRAAADQVQDDLPPEATLRDLGSHRLRDLQQAEHIFQLLHPDLPRDFPSLRSLEAFAHNLPRQLTSFIGREREMAEVKQLLDTMALLTLTGSGGCGKTRLALQVAADVLEQYPDGVWLVDLAPLADPDLVQQAVANVLGVREVPGRALEATLADHLRSRSLLLVMDNCEHLLVPCAQLAERLLQVCPRLRVLATSREGLGIAGERTLRVPSLSIPDERPAPECMNVRAPERLLEYEAVRLFVERASVSEPSFRMTEQNALALAHVCSRLEGIPLAVELAAVRVKALSVEQLSARLGDFFHLLTGGSRTALPRQQTLRATIDWSYDLLSEPERLLLRRLSVFAGGWTLEAAETVCGGCGIQDWEVLALLTSLVEKSLVLSEVQDGAARYRLLETIRQYAREKLLEASESEEVCRRHRDHFLALAEEAAPHLFGSGQVGWQQRLGRDFDNLRAALDWSLTCDGGMEAALRLVGALWQLWVMGSHIREGREGTTRALSRGRDAPPLLLARVLDAARVFAFFQGDYESARSLAEEGLQFAREANDPSTVAHALFGVALLAVQCGDLDRALACAEEGMALSLAEGDRFSLGRHLVVMALDAWMRDDYAASRALFRETLAISQELDDEWHIGMTLANLGFVTRRDGDREEARMIHREGLTICQRLGDRRGVAWHLLGMAGVEVEGGRVDRAARLLGAAAGVIEATYSLLPPPQRKEHDHTLCQIEALLSEDALSNGWGEGRAMALEEAISYALEVAADG